MSTKGVHIKYEVAAFICMYINGRQSIHCMYVVFIQPNSPVEKEAMHINRSLSFLEQVVVALNDTRRDHVPFRQSKLTHFLRDSLGKGTVNLLYV